MEPTTAAAQVTETVRIEPGIVRKRILLPVEPGVVMPVYALIPVSYTHLKEFEITFQYVDEELIRLGLKATCQNAVNRERSAVDFQLFNVMQQEVKPVSYTHLPASQ